MGLRECGGATEKKLKGFWEKDGNLAS